MPPRNLAASQKSREPDMNRKDLMQQTTALFLTVLIVALTLPGVSRADDSQLVEEWSSIQTTTDRDLQRAWWQTTTSERLRRFVRAGVNVNLSNKKGWSPLHSAVRYSNNIEVVEVLLEAGAEVGATNNSGDTPLHWAARANPDERFTQTLIDAGADVNARDKFGWSAVLTAAEGNSNPQVIATLIDAGANPKKRAYFMLFGPKFLVKHNANMSDADKKAAIKMLKAAG